MLNGPEIPLFLTGRQHGLKLKQTGNPEAAILWIRKTGERRRKPHSVETHCALPLYNTACKCRVNVS